MTLHDYLFTLLLSMAPVSELRGAIPFGLAHDIPQALLQSVDYVCTSRRDEPPQARPSSIIKLGSGGLIEIIRP